MYPAGGRCTVPNGVGVEVNIRAGKSARGSKVQGDRSGGQFRFRLDADAQRESPSPMTTSLCEAGPLERVSTQPRRSPRRSRRTAPSLASGRSRSPHSLVSRHTKSRNSASGFRVTQLCVLAWPAISRTQGFLPNPTEKVRSTGSSAFPHRLAQRPGPFSGLSCRTNPIRTTKVGSKC